MLNQSAAPARLIAKRFAPISDNSPEPQKLSLNERIAALPWRGTKRGEKVMLSLSEAATAAGVAKSPILWAVKAGRGSPPPTALGKNSGGPGETVPAVPSIAKNGATEQ